MKIVALAGGIGAGKFLRGLVRVVDPVDLTVVVNTGDDITVHGLHVSPDVDSVIYWLAGEMDRERGWGRAGETFRATEALRTLGAEGSWFGLGDLDLATHLLRTARLAGGATMTGVTDELRVRFGVAARILPMSDQAVTTRVDVVDDRGQLLDLHFQEYWVLRGASDEVKGIRYEGAHGARPGPGVLDAIRQADAVLLCPSNPVASIGPILAIPGVAESLRARRDVCVGVSPIVGGAPLRGMADKMLPVVGVEVTAAGVAGHYAAKGIVAGWVIDEIDGSHRGRVENLGLRLAVTDTIMVDDVAAERLARIAVGLAMAPAR